MTVDKMTKKKLKISQEISLSHNNKSEVRPSKLPQYMAALSANLGALGTGLIVGWTSPAGVDGANLIYPFDIDSYDFSWVSSIYNLGAATIAIPIGGMADLIGRRSAMLVLTIPLIIGWACVIWPNSVTTLIFGRFMLGVGGGAFIITAPMYTAEISDSETRGRLCSYFELLVFTGILTAYTLGLLRNMFLQSLISAIVPLIFFTVFFFMPETPTYHLIKGNVEGARKTLIWLRGSHYDVESELAEKQNALADVARNKVSFFVAIRSRATIVGLLIGCGLMCFQAFSGIDVVIFYASSIFKDAIGKDVKSFPIITAATQVIGLFLLTIVIDIWGRRILLMISGAGMCVASLVLGLHFYLQMHGTSMDNFTWLPLVCVCGFTIFGSVGFDSIPGMMAGELFSPQVKGVATSSVCLFGRLLTFVVTKFYSQVKEKIGPDKTFWIFSFLCGLSVIFVFFVVLETKCKTLEQIQIALTGYSAGKWLRKIVATRQEDTS